ncbi:IS1/IS1595 family N-terminal zinc-binding domain-containing protein [Photobacterium leiognathi]|uniref:IS1/IS1595 family N-terminal zinc-binding domain-containing protein n=1 Tax=Photobacterium leiognathi TaxID=553611 RepID=UPI00387F6CB0
MILYLQCPKCDGSENIHKNRHSTSGYQRYQCTNCRHTFQTNYSMKGYELGMHEKLLR